MQNLTRESATVGVEELVRASAPRPLLSRTDEAKLGVRHREVLDELEDLFMTNGFSSFTIAELAREIGCSRRTLYELAPSKDQLVLIVLDRRLHRMGRAALGSIVPTAPLLDQVRQYIQGGVEYQMFAPLLDDLTEDAPARRLVDRHYRFVMTVVQRLVALGIERGEFTDVDPAVVGAVVTGSSLYMMQPGISADTGLEVAELVSGMLELVLGGLPSER
ncbi:MAG: TetR/AcrR family transcriptional regulator [Acidimicrobiia bacterium]|nr:TetR/AcrR family transcriptional regulator [Acidimicrobiia bacterium]